MASTKHAVTDFMQLGAKYELILAGLYEDVTRLRGSFDEVETQNRTSVEAVTQARETMNEVRTVVLRAQKDVIDLQAALRRQRTVNLLLACVAVAAIALGFVS